ncbi:phenylacetate-CoA oxygenase subunit PaaC [Chitinophaga pendula]|uniref:1,2-phenylacetyl-CoA epoxidase subunit PaaC n=1 Tax=Chitinophaga TaxID=79328 RepID=UPI000BAFBBFE|nr:MULTISPECIES: 1,2-phenylacetyl-CoA epoxidase subunit PaaC [Chitinophaga]ASZ10393.1 phenylacetate-CoA oxygenase subunit PaaI [Chitinophaga sp. MD30]UCJ06642.1 phenylacetate-CoA oxygenase subunit PaaC [Chitinophaga pendula]
MTTSLNTDIAVTDLITKMADDELIIGHRNSEWTGLGPVMEEDIAFSSMAQDKIGHALALYTILHEQLQGADPDQFAFMREASAFKCCHLVELPIGDYDFSLMRHFLFDHAEAVRYRHLLQSSYTPLKQLSQKVKGELKYHTLHANAWLLQLCRAGADSHARMQAALDTCFPLACGIFEPAADEVEALLIAEAIYPGEEVLYNEWLDQIYPILAQAGLNLPDVAQVRPAYGGRGGQHTKWLVPMLNEMGAVFRLDPQASW